MTRYQVDFSFYKYSEVRRLLGLSQPTIRHWARLGIIGKVNFDRYVRVPDFEVQRMLKIKAICEARKIKFNRKAVRKIAKEEGLSSNKIPFERRKKILPED